MVHMIHWINGVQSSDLQWDSKHNWYINPQRYGLMTIPQYGNTIIYNALQGLTMAHINNLVEAFKRKAKPYQMIGRCNTLRFFSQG